jgi:hypothetical protein
MLKTVHQYFDELHERQVEMEAQYAIVKMR